MSTLKVSNINNASASSGGLAIDSSGVVSGGLPTPNRNFIYNGAMQVHQRGVSVSGITASSYNTADRWALSTNGTVGTWTQTVENDAPTGSGFRKSLKMLCTTANAAPAAADLLQVFQVLEGQDVQRIAKGTSAAQQLTVSFWVKSNVTGTHIVELRDLDNSRFVSASYSVSASATWEKKVVTFPADTTGSFDNDNNASLYLNFWLIAGSDFSGGTLGTTWHTTTANRAVGQTNVAANTNNYWQITGVQLEVGPTATPFEFKSYGTELKECQRYYQQIVDDTSQMIGMGYYRLTTQIRVVYHMNTTMRTSPTIVQTTGTDYFYIEPSAGNDSFDGFDSVAGVSPNALYFVTSTGVSGTAGAVGHCMSTTNAGGRLALSAEL